MDRTVVYFRHLGELDSPEREAMTDEARARWTWLGIVEPFNFVELTPSKIGCNAFTFQRESRIYADLHGTDPYVLVDSDMLIGSDYSLAKHVALLSQYPEFAILSAMTTAPGMVIHPWTPENYQPFVDENVMEHVSVGNLRLCQKGLLKKWPNQIRSGYDREHCKALRDAGWRVGFARQFPAIHLGEGKTTLF